MEGKRVWYLTAWSVWVRVSEKFLVGEKLGWATLLAMPSCCSKPDELNLYNQLQQAASN